jgi:glycerol-3-phosphate dehydrogenase (NAD(P)+)
MTQVIADCLEETCPANVSLTVPIGALSGPSFALEVAQGQPTAVTVAFDDPAFAARIQSEFSSESLRLYTSTDVIGVELGGALKNVIAIAAGVASGVGLGYNSAAALMTRGIAEITRLAVACGGHRETLAGLSGVGDLVLTCTGSLSRNRTVGQELGRGRKLPEILASLDGKVAEGVFTTRAALGLARQHGIEMPIAEQMELILNEGKDPHEAIHEGLMLRPGKDERGNSPILAAHLFLRLLDNALNLNLEPSMFKLFNNKKDTPQPPPPRPNPRRTRPPNPAFSAA